MNTSEISPRGPARRSVGVRGGGDGNMARTLAGNVRTFHADAKEVLQMRAPRAAEYRQA